MSRRLPSPRLWTVVVLGLLAAGCWQRQEVTEGTLSCLVGRERWHATDVSARLSSVERPGGEPELALTLVARRDPEGERLTFLVLTDELLGTHEVQVFGALAGLDPGGGGEPLPVANACTAGDPSLRAGTLSIEGHDPETRRLRGSFIVQVCDVHDPGNARTLGDGVFADVRY